MRTIDAAGNEDDNVVYRSAVPNFDSTPPTFAGLTSAIDDQTDGAVVLSWTSATETQSLPLTYQLYWSSTPGQELAAGPKVSGYTGTSYRVQNLVNGTAYGFAVRAVDGVGNVDPNTVVQTATPTRDATPPTFAGLATATDLGSNATVRLTWAAASEQKSPPVTYDLYYGTSEATLRDTVRVANLPQNATQYVVSGLTPDVTTYFAVHAKDARGNRDGNTVTLSVIPTLDTIPPTFSGISLAQAGESGSVDLLWPQATEGTSLPVRYRVYVGTDQGTLFSGTPMARVAYTSTRCASGVLAQHCVTGLTNGVTYWFGVRAEDGAQNVDGNTVALSAVPADTAPPQFSSLAVTPAVATLGDVLSVSFTVSEPLAIDPQVTLDSDGLGTEAPLRLSSVSGLRYTYEYGVSGGEAEGSRTITLRAVDLASNDGVTTTAVLFDFTQDLDPPTVTFVAPIDGDQVNTARPDLSLTFDDATASDGSTSSGLACATLQLKIDSTVVFSGCGAYNPTTGIGFSAGGTPPNLLRYRPPAALGAGTHLVSARIADADGNDSGWQSITITVVPADRLVLSPSSARLAPGAAQAFTASFSGDTAACVWNTELAGGTLDVESGAQVVYTPEAAPGTYTLRVECPDPAGGAPQQASASIRILNLLSVEPAIATLPAGGQQLFAATSDLTGSYAWQVSGGGSLVLDAADDTRLTFRAGFTAGRYFITATDTDNDLSATATINVLPADFTLGQAIVVGGGSMSDHLWADTRALTEYAYAVLESRGFTDDSIYFMSQATSFDLDGDGRPEVDALASSSPADGLEYAITDWARARGGPLFLYLVDHGGVGSMWLRDADGDAVADPDELLQASDLGAWLDTLPETTPVVVLYEACKSGSFVEALAGPNRVIVTSTGFENATIALDGNISFSQYWLAAVGEGQSVGDAFGVAAAAMAVVSPQVPVLDDDGDGAGNGPLDGDLAAGTYVGFPYAGENLGTTIVAARAKRQVGQPPALRGERAILEAVVTSSSAVSEVYALVVPPSYVPPPPSEQFETPELDLVRLDLTPTGVADTFAATTAVLGELGTYRFLVYAKDSGGERALPRQASLQVVNAAPRLLALTPADGDSGVRIDTAIGFSVEDPDGIDWDATRLFVSGVEVTADLTRSGSATRLQALYEVAAGIEHPTAATVAVRIETRDLAAPPVAAVYTASFATAGGLTTTMHQPPPYSSGNPGGTQVSVHVVDQGGFGINPGSLSLSIDGEVVPALVFQAAPNSLDELVLVYAPAAPFSDGPVEVEVRAADTAGHLMPPDRYFFFVGAGSPGDTTAPLLASLVPAAGATGVAPEANLTLVLTDDAAVDFASIAITVDPASAAARTYVLGNRELTCTPHPTLGAAEVTCVVDPLSSFASGESVALTVAATDTADNVMTPVLASFTVLGETTPPSVTQASPAANALGVAMEAPISFHVVDFGSGVDLASIVMSVDGTAVSPSISGTPRDYLVTYAGPGLTYSSRHTVSVSAQDLAGNALAAATWSFTTDTGMRVIATSPQARALGVPVTQTLTVELEDLASPTVTFDLSTLRLRLDNREVTPEVSGTAGHVYLSYTPSPTLPYDRLVQVDVTAKDSRGNDMPPYRFTFTTVSDDAAPYLRGLAPAPFSTGVAADSAVSFEVLDDGAGVSLSSLEVRLGATLYVAGHPSFSATPIALGYAVRVTPADLFYAGDVIPVVLNARDTFGNAMAQVAYSFTVGDESEPPVATFLSPLCPASGGTSGVARTAPVVVGLEDAGAGVDLTSIDLRAGGAPATALEIAGNSRELRVTYRPALGFNQTLSLSVTARDLSATGNAIAPPVAHSFTTTSGVDGDGDGMPTDFEVCYFANGAAALPGDDADGDGATNLQEYQDGTNPRDPADVRSVSADSYEVDDNPNLASTIVPGSGAQLHNFHQAGDADWLRFVATPGRTYRVATSGLQGRSDTVLTLYDATGAGVLAFNNNRGEATRASEITFTVPDGASPVTYFVAVRGADASVFGAFTGYTVGVYEDAVAPSISAVSPEDGARTSILTPAIAATITDDDSGVDASSVSLRLDGDECPSTFDAATGLLSAVACSPLAGGAHVLELSARDLTGNLGIWRSVFTVTDFAVLPGSLALTADGPAAPLTAAGGVDPLTWSASGGTLDVAPDGRAAAFTPGSTPGAFTLVVTDANGRQSTSALTVQARLAIKPSYLSVGPGESATLRASFDGAAPTFGWTAAGGTLDVDAGPEVVFTAGTTPGVYELVLTEAGSASTARATVNVLAENVGEAVILAATDGFTPEVALSIEASAEHAYRAMIRRGFNRERIHFLSGSAGVSFDGDENGVADDLDGGLDRGAVFELFTQVLPERLGPQVPLVVYLVGGRSDDRGFVMGEGERLEYAELAELIALLEADVGLRHLVLVADTDRALGAMTLAGPRRVLVTSTGAADTALHRADSEVSFSYAFFNRVFVGESVGDAFVVARGTLQILGSGQRPSIDDDGNGLVNEKSDGPLASVTYIGEPGLGSEDVPVIAEHTPDVVLESGTRHELFARVLSAELLDAVQVTIVPPQTSSEPVVTLAMAFDSATGHYLLDYPGFGSSGVYRIVYSARDIRGRAASPVESRLTTPGPYVEGLFPAPGMRGLSPSTLLYFTLADASDALDLASLSVLVDGVEQASLCTTDASDPSRVPIVCDPPSDFALGAGVSVTLAVSNLGGVAMPPFTFGFTITDGVDQNGDGLPEDFQTLVAPTSAPGEDTDRDGMSNAAEFVAGTNPIQSYPPDAFEPDDDSPSAARLTLGAGQAHTFHAFGDSDWVVFACAPFTYYEVATSDLGAQADTVVRVYQSDGTTLLAENDDYSLTSPESRVLVACTSARDLYIEVRSYDPAALGAGTDYTLTVQPKVAATGALYGEVRDAVTGAPIGGASLVLDAGVDQVRKNAFADGSYLIDAPPGSGYRLLASAQGYVERQLEGVVISPNTFSHVPVTLQPAALPDGDGDGMPDAWESTYGLDPADASDAAQDLDADGRDNLGEYLNGTDPTVSNAPTAPVIAAPLDGASVIAPVTLRVFNAQDIDSAYLTYFFTLTDDSGAELESSGAVAEMVAETSFTPATALVAGTYYRWSVYASDGTLAGPAVSGRFLVVGASQPPAAPALFAPPNGSSVASTTPALELVNASDADGDVVGYTFEVYADSALTAAVAQSPLVAETAARTAWTVDVALADGSTYFWRARAEDADAHLGPWSEVWSFTVDTTVVLPPAATFMTPSTEGELLPDNPPTLAWSGVATDGAGGAVTYDVVVDVSQAYDTPLRQEQAGVVVDGSNIGRFTPAAALDSDQTYYVRVVGNNAAGAGPAVEISFRVLPSAADQLPAPELISPANLQEVSATPTLVAGAVVDPQGSAVTYDFELYGDVQLSFLVEATSGVSDDGARATWRPQTKLEAGGSYVWRARAVDFQGAPGLWAEPAMFYVEAAGGGKAKGGCSCDGAGGGIGLFAQLTLAAYALLRRKRR